MSKKKRVFDIEMPEENTGETAPVPAGKKEEGPRRGPMAAAIAETMDSGRQRQELEADIRAENDALAHEHVRMKKAGLVLSMVPLDEIDASKLVRDRYKGEDLQLKELTASILAVGLSNPIQVEETLSGRYELIQGYRRLEAFKALLAQTEDGERFGTIPASVMPMDDDIEQLYRKMVDENLVRKDISFAEMAQLAVHYASDHRTSTDDADKAVSVLFQSTGYQKRSYIRAFIPVMDRLDKYLKFPAEIPRALGLALGHTFEIESGVPKMIIDDLPPWEHRSVEEELNVLRRHAKLDKEIETGIAAPQPKKADGKAPAKARTSFQFSRPEGRTRCVAGQGLIEVRVDRDFSAFDRRRLERAVNALLDALSG